MQGRSAKKLAHFRDRAYHLENFAIEAHNGRFQLAIAFAPPLSAGLPPSFFKNSDSSTVELDLGLYNVTRQQVLGMDLWHLLEESERVLEDVEKQHCSSRGAELQDLITKADEDTLAQGTVYVLPIGFSGPQRKFVIEGPVTRFAGERVDLAMWDALPAENTITPVDEAGGTLQRALADLSDVTLT